MEKKKNIALVAHDEHKLDMLEWAMENSEILSGHNLYGTGTTGTMLYEKCNLDITRLKSGPLGGDLQLGSMIAEDQLDILIFFWDPMTAQPHDVDVKALLRISAVNNIPIACNRSTADFLIKSTLFNEEYHPVLKDYGSYIRRPV